MNNLVITCGLILVASLIVVFFLYLNYRKRYPGVTQWMTGWSLLIVSFVLLATQDIAPVIISVVIANVIMILSFIIILSGLQQFFDISLRQSYNYFLLGVVFFVQSYFTFIQPSLEIRTILISLSLFLVISQCAWVSWKAQLRDHIAMWRSIFIFIAIAVLFLFRGLRPFIMEYGTQGIFQPDPIDNFVILFIQLLFLIMAYNLTLIINQRLLFEAEAREKEMREESQARGMFIDIIAHELKTPLTPIINSADTLSQLSQNDPDNIKTRLVNNIHKSARVMADRLGEFLEIATYARGTFKLNLSSVELNPFLTDILSRYESMIESNGKRLVSIIADDLPETAIDAPKIEQVITNLFVNAINYGQDKSLIEFRAFVDGPSLRIDVQNEGKSIRAEEQKNLFKPYHRVLQDRNKPGLGLGLAVCKQIIDAHGGDIWLDNDQDNKTTFSVSVPLKKISINKPISLQSVGV